MVTIEYKKVLPKIEDYWPLFLSTGWNEIFNLDDSHAKNAISNSTFFVSAYFQSKLVGFARAMSDKIMYATIYDVIVHPEYRQMGIGSKLVENITKQCKLKFPENKSCRQPHKDGGERFNH